MALCGCNGWHQEQMLKINERVSEAVGEMEKEFQRHAGIDASVIHSAHSACRVRETV